MAYTDIDKPSDYFNTKLYSGNSTDDTSITGVGFQPDWLWIKERTNTSGHQLQDVVRGATKQLFSNDTQAEATNTTKVKSFDSDGFTLGTSGSVNVSGDTYVAWNWKAGTSSGITTTNSTITPAGYSFNQTAGFSIIKYPGNGTNDAKCPHGLGVAPKMIFIKDLDNAANWECYNASIGNGKVIYLNLTTAAEATSARWRNTSPDSVNWTMGSTTAVNGSGRNYVAYCFADVKGYSKISSYIGTGNVNGSYIHLGFKPAFFILKRTDASEQWLMKDNKRPDYNPNYTLYPNLTNAEDTSASVLADFVSNGVKLRGTYNGMNASGATYIYMAFAESPFVSSSGVPATAR